MEEKPDTSTSIGKATICFDHALRCLMIEDESTIDKRAFKEAAYERAEKFVTLGNALVSLGYLEHEVGRI